MGAHPGPAARVRFVLSFHFVITPRRGSGLSEEKWWEAAARVREISRRTLPVICSSWPRTDPGSSIEMHTLGHPPTSAEISQPIHRTTALFIFTLPPARSLRVGAAFHSDSYAPRPRPQPAVWRGVGRCSVSFCRCDSSTAVRFPMSFSAPATHWTPLRSFKHD